MQIRASFRSKLLLLTLVPLGIAQLVTLFAVMRTVEQDLQSRARESLNTGAVVVTEYLAARSAQLRTSVEVLAADYGLKEASATGDENTIRSVLENHGRRIGTDFLAILDIDGRPIVSTVALSAATTLDPRLLADNFLSGPGETAALIADTAYQLYTVPLRAPVTIGWVVVGFPIDNNLAMHIQELTGLDTSFVLAESPPETIVTTRVHAPLELRLHAENDTVFMTNQHGDQALTIHTEFVAGDETILVVLQRSLREAMLPYTDARRGLLIFAAVLLLFVAIAGAWFSTTIAEPIKTLAAAARRMISGDYNSCIVVRTDDEFGELASSFNAMQSAIAEREQRISHHALHDPLTDLPNRALVLKGLTSLVEQARNADANITVLSIGLVRMSEISSTLGHGATDDLIKMAARHLRANLAEAEILGHTGTNEFVVVLPGQDVDGAMTYVDRIEGLLASGITLGRINVILQAQIGIAEFPRHATAAADLLRLAAIARTEAESADERVCIYQPGHEDEFVRRLRIVNDLPAALRRGDVQVWFQPKVSLPDGKVCGAEALVRWQHPTLGFLQPDDFVPAAEQSGMIVVLTRHVLAAAVRECRHWDSLGHDLQISVNLSARDLRDEYLPYHVKQILDEHGLPAERLTIEVTESSIMENLTHAVSILDCLRDIGVKLSMDDFGTGHSSLAKLRNIPLHELKIDRAFVTTLASDARNAAIVKTTVELAHSMNLWVVAEGVEDIDTMRRLAAMGCAQAQGFLLSKPITAESMRAWLQNYQPVSFANRRKRTRAFAGRSAS
ncbi:MAG: EAL domain-containing protein [Gammaproteobacteria bacterium]|nr:EAL domain-containing protein [Gammaproteobacteria bacterium]MDH5302592.1 EAL domain-containing protein [Gammaproteobacteria bacterium]MDH5321071.1 EAL domain-containing protein [Gammaproteobacteria bacterium]